MEYSSVAATEKATNMNVTVVYGGRYDDDVDAEGGAPNGDAMPPVAPPMPPEPNPNSGYQGERKAGKAEGRGTHWYTNGTVYAGTFKDGKPEGQGTCWYKSGDVCDGTWKDRKMEGRGTYWSKNGGMYNGEWKAGEREGRGTFLGKNGYMDVSTWKANKRDGDGVWWSKDRRTAWLLKDGDVVREISLMDAETMSRTLGFPDCRGVKGSGAREG